jgi:hypothetical protein
LREWGQGDIIALQEHLLPTENTKIQWHQAFFNAMQLELEDYADALEFKSEYQLNAEPLRVDAVIIKKRKDVTIEKAFARIFRTDNIMEYKSPEDSASIWDLYKTCAYCFLYASIHKLKADDLTLTIVETKYARDAIKCLQAEFGCRVEEKYPGIYQASGGEEGRLFPPFPVQIIESKRLLPEEAELLRNLRNNLGVKDIEKLLLDVKKHKDPQYLAIYLKTVLLANKTAYREAIKMDDEIFDEIFEGTSLAARWEERGEKRGEERGEERGEKRGEKRMIELLKSGKTPEEIIRMYDEATKLLTATERV